MNKSHLLAGTAMLALAFSTGAALAQPADDQAAHHPNGDATVPAPQPQPGREPGGMMSGQKSGMPMMPGMASNPTPNGAGSPMMGGDMQQMMRMMTMMRGRMAHENFVDEMGAVPFEHVEGRIAFLKAEIAITEAQQPAWTAFADAMRSQATAMRTMHERAAQGATAGSWPEQLALEDAMLSASLDAVKAIEGPAQSLYGVLTAEQKTKADDLMGHPMGRM